MNQGQTTSVIIIIALVAFGLGYYAGTNASQTEGFEKGWQAAKERLNENSFFNDSEKVKRVFGEVETVNGNTVSVKIEPVHPLMDPELDTRMLEITDDTNVYKMVEIERENEDADGPMQEVLPNRSERKGVDVEALEAGQLISAYSIDDENIREKKSFKVSEIVIERDLSEGR